MPKAWEPELRALGTHSECAVKPTQLGKRLLDDGVAGIVNGRHHVEAVAESPMSGRVVVQWSDGLHTQIAIVLLKRRKTIFISVEPKRCLIAGYGALHLHLVVDVFARLPLSGISTFLPRILGRNSTGEAESSKGKKDSFRHFLPLIVNYAAKVRLFRDFPLHDRGKPFISLFFFLNFAT